MNRQFHAKISLRHYTLLAALLSVALYFTWHTELLARQWIGMVLGIVLVLMVVLVEKIINTHYTVTTDTKLLIHEGRFAKDKTVDILSIDRIDRINRLRILGKPLITYLIIVMTDGKEHCVMPKNEEDFIKCIAQRRTQKEKQTLDDCND